MSSNDVDRAVNSPANATRQTDDLGVAIANSRDAMQGAGNTGPVIVVKIAHAGHNLFDFLARHFRVP